MIHVDPATINVTSGAGGAASRGPFMVNGQYPVSWVRN
jgi:hypothetical protein